MSILPRPTRRLAGLAAGAVLAPVCAQAQQTLAPVTVTATPVPTRIERIGTSVTVIDRQTIEDRQYRTLPRALRSVPGLRVVQSGPRGQQTSVFMRGAASNQTLVLLDGQRIADPSTPGGAFDFGGLTLDAVQRIEVVRGPQSSLHGSDAIGGVINIVTRHRVEPGVRGEIRAEAGTRATADVGANVRGRTGSVAFDVTVSGTKTDGDTVTPARFRPPGASAEDDGHRRTSGSARLRADLSDHLDLSLYGAVRDSETELDDEPEDPNSEGHTLRTVARAALQGSFRDGRYKPSLRLGYVDVTRDNTNPPDRFSGTRIDTRNEGRRFSATLENEIAVHPDHTLVAGVEVRAESFESSGAQAFATTTIRQRSDAESTTVAAYVQDVVELTPRLSGTVGLRFDKPETFEGQATWHVAPTYRFPATGTRLKASVGTGFKTPSLFQRFGFNPTSAGTVFRGNPDLDAETSFGWDAGIEQRLFDDRVRVGATVFRNEIEDGVTTVFDANFNSTTVNNVDIDTWGVESFVRVAPTDRITLRADHTYLEAENENTGQRLVRRPRHRVTVSARWRPTRRATLTGGVRAVADTVDIGRRGGRVELNDYVVARLAGSYRLSDRVEVTARVENLTDATYEIADGFQAPGRQVFVGTRFRF